MKIRFYRIKPAIVILSLILIFGTSPVYAAGPNESAGCALDLNYETDDYDTEITSQDIETTIEAKDEEIWVGVIAQNVSNLDTYQVEVSFDPDRISFLEGYEDNTFAGIRNLLKTNGGTTVGFQAVENTPGNVNIANSLTGSDEDQAPEGSGIIALLKFKVLAFGSDIQLTLSNVKYMDSEGSNEPLVIDEITNLDDAAIDVPEKGDVNGSLKADLADAVLALQVVAGMNPDDVYAEADVNGDQKIGLEEVVYILKALSDKQSG